MSTAEFARKLPWRRVIDPRPVAKYTSDGSLLADYLDLLECGHIVEHPWNRHAKRRRCYMCGQEHTPK